MGPLAADELGAAAADEPAVVAAGALEADVLDDDALELHPAICSAAAATAAPPAAMRVRLSLNIVFTRSLREKGSLAGEYIGVLVLDRSIRSRFDR
jgi:hypothetical protein